MRNMNQTMSKQRTIAAWMVAGLAVAACALPARAQTTPATDDLKRTPVLPTPIPPKRVRSVRAAVVDLGQMAKDRRPGQVMPGDPAPMGAAAPKPIVEESANVAMSQKPGAPIPVPSAAESTRVKESVKLPDTAPANKPVLKPSIETQARPEVLGGTRPEPLPEPSAVPPPPPSQPAPVMEPASVVAPQVQIAPEEPSVAPARPRAALEPAKPDRPEVGGIVLVEGVVLNQIPAALATGPAKVRVESIGGIAGAGGVQWRTGGGEWKNPSVGETVEGVVEVRAGLDSELVLIVDDLAKVSVARLGRASFERCSEKGGVTTVGLRVDRGAVEVRPFGTGASGLGGSGGPGEMFARVRTPDQSFGLTGPLRVEYDAFSGTRRRVVNP